ISQAHNGAMPVDDYLEWVSLLKSCAVFGAYCRVYTANVQPETVAEFLLLDPESPQSVRFGGGMIARALDAIASSAGIPRRTELFRIAGKLVSSLSFDRIDEIFREDLRTYVAEVRAQCTAIHDEVYNACISYPVETAVRA
ncbi:MAG: alpha-E domain-containing protein, partial [Rhodothermales bacterium]|nr:alpha-E domain-containing protein [Rhodothermales bacterium]